MEEAFMYKMIADHRNIGGGVYFYKTYLEWKPRNYSYKEYTFRVDYDDIEKVDVVRTLKKKIFIKKKDGTVYQINLYRLDTFLYTLDQVRAAKDAPIDAEIVPTPEEDGLSKLERLAKLKESGAITEEEYLEAKKKILGEL